MVRRYGGTAVSRVYFSLSLLFNIWNKSKINHKNACFASYFFVTLPLQLRCKRRLRAAAQRRPSELTSAFTLHRSCNAFQKWRARRSQVTRTERKGPPHGADEARADSGTTEAQMQDSEFNYTSYCRVLRDVAMAACQIAISGESEKKRGFCVLIRGK